MGKKKKFQVAIMHGHSDDYKIIKQIINECKFTARILIDEFFADTIFENLRELIWKDIHCVIIILTKDDEMKDGLKRARQNVVFELGYCFGAFDSLPDNAPYKAKNALIIIAEKDIELFADIDGLAPIQFETGKILDRKEFIVQALKKSYKKAKAYYDL